jgi:hypothetical protein
MEGWIWKKLKDEYPKLRLFKVWVLNCKSDEILGVISEVFPNIFLYDRISKAFVFLSCI